MLCGEQVQMIVVVSIVVVDVVCVSDGDFCLSEGHC